MTQHDDQQLVDYLFDELSEEEAGGFERLLEDDAELSSEVSSLGDTLDAMRALEPEDPPDWLSAKVLAEARQTAEAAAEEAEKKSLWGRLRKLMWGPAGGLIGAGVAAVALAVVVTPQMVAEQAPPSADAIAIEMAERELARPEGAAAPMQAGAEEARAQIEAELAARAAAESKAAAAPEPEPTPDLERSASPAGRRAPPPAAKPAPSKKRRSRRARPAVVQDPSLDDAIGEVKGGAVGRVSSGAGAPMDAPATAKATPAPPAPRRAPEPAPPPLEVDEDAPAFGDVAPAPKAEEKAKDTGTDPEQVADELLRAAQGEVARGDLAAARRVLIRAASRLANYPARGRIFVARAELELRVKDYAAATRYARAALEVPGFDGKDDARALLRRIARESQPRDEAAPAAPPR